MATAWLVTDDDARVALSLPPPGEVAAIAETPCACGSDRIVGDGMEREGHDGYRARGFCLSCKARRGIIHARVETIFGVEEDERVLGGPWKVY